MKVTRPDGSVVKGDGSFEPGSDTVTTDFLGNLTYDYQLQSVPAVEGTYLVDVLGLGDAVLAHTEFEDAVTIKGLYLGSVSNPNETYIYTAGNNIVADSVIDNSTGSPSSGTRRSYKFFVLDTTNAIRNSPVCT